MKWKSLLETKSLPQQFAASVAEKFSAIIYLSAAKKSFLNYTPQHFTLIRSDAMTVMNDLRLNSKFLIGIPHHDIRIVSNCQLTFTFFKANQLSGCRA